MGDHDRAPPEEGEPWPEAADVLAGSAPARPILPVGRDVRREFLFRLTRSCRGMILTRRSAEQRSAAQPADEDRVRRVALVVVHIIALRAGGWGRSAAAAPERAACERGAKRAPAPHVLGHPVSRLAPPSLLPQPLGSEKARRARSPRAMTDGPPVSRPSGTGDGNPGLPASPTRSVRATARGRRRPRSPKPAPRRPLAQRHGPLRPASVQAPHRHAGAARAGRRRRSPGPRR